MYDNTVRFIEDGIIKTYDAIADADIIREKLDLLAKNIQLPAFHKGNLDPEFLNSDEFFISDSLQFAIERNRFDSQGSGTFFCSNLADVIDWQNIYRKENAEGVNNLYLIDLAKYKSGMFVIEGDDASDRWSSFLEKISAFIMNQITSEEYRFLSEKIDTSEKMYHYCQNIFEKLNVDKKSFQAWVEDEIERVRDAIYYDNCQGEISINTSFQKNLLKITGLDLSKTAFDDSIARGSIVFDIDKKEPFLVDFGEHQDLARYFFDKIHMQVLARKMENIDKRDIDILLYNYEDALLYDSKSANFKELSDNMHNIHSGFLVAKYLSNVAKNMNVDVSKKDLEKAVMQKILSIKAADLWKAEIERHFEEMYGEDVGEPGFQNKNDDPLVKAEIEDWLEKELGIDVGKAGFRNRDNDPRNKINEDRDER